MPQRDNQEHYIKRAQQEREMAARATDPTAAISHNALAALFDKIIAQKMPGKREVH